MSKQHVIFVEPAPDSLKAFEKHFADHTDQWQMVFCATAEDALEQLIYNDGAVIVANRDLGELSGAQFIEKVGQFERDNSRQGGHFVIFTGPDDEEGFASALNQGANDFISPPFEWDQLAQRIQVGFISLKTTAQLRKTINQLGQLTTLDPLTEVYNRNHGAELLQQELSRAGRGLLELAIILFEVDRFTEIISTNGAAAADAVLKHVAALIRRSCRNYDAVIHWDDSRILVICPHTSPVNVGIIAHRLFRKAIATPIEIEPKKTLKITVSMGTTAIPAGERCTSEGLLTQANTALTKAEQQGGNCVVHAATAEPEETLS